jgi:hypothetical protein
MRKTRTVDLVFQQPVCSGSELFRVSMHPWVFEFYTNYLQ